MPLREDLLAPIAGANPGGENLRYAPVYDKIKEARREDDDAPQGEWQRERKVADFNLVIKLAGEALATKSKDLQLAAWLTEAVLRKEGFSGLREGLELLRGLLAEFWDTLYPEIEDGDLELRAAPLDWVGAYLGDCLRKTGITRSGLNYYKFKESRAVGYEEQANESDTKRAARETAVAEGKPTGEEFDAAVQNTSTALYEAWVGSLDASLATLEALNEICGERFGEYAPGFSKLRTALEEVRQVVNSIWQQKLDGQGRPAAVVEEVAEEEAPEVQPAFVTSSSSGAAAAPARTAPRRAVVGLEPADPDDAALRLAAVAKYLRQADGYSPAPYLMLRGYRWGELRGYGENPDSSLLAAPSTETRQQIKRLALDANWAELIETAETAMAEPCGRAWLDLQRYVVRACDEYGYPAIAAAIKAELKALLKDLPSLTEWTLADDTPTANGETLAWIREFSQPEWTPARAAAIPEETETGDAPDGFELAMEKVRSGRAGEGIEMLARDIQLQTSGRGRFHRKVQLAQLCMATGHDALAHPILEDLVTEIDRHLLEQWESPEVVAHALSLLYRSIEKHNGDPALKQKIYARICRLDPIQALACGG